MRPTITSQKAGLGGKLLVVGFSEKVSGTPANEDFVVTVDGTKNAVTNIAIAENGLTALLTVTSNFQSGTTILLNYVYNADNKIIDSSGGSMASTSSNLTVSTAGPTVTDAFMRQLLAPMVLERLFLLKLHLVKL